MSTRTNVYGGRSIPGEFSGVELDPTPAEHAPSPLKTMPVHELGDAGYGLQPGDPLFDQQQRETLDAIVAAQLTAGPVQQRR